MELPSLDERVRFLIDLGKTLHGCGASSPRIERHLGNTAEMLGLKGSFLVTPTSITFALWTDDPYRQTHHLARLEPGSMDLGKLWQVDEVIEKMAAEELNFAQGRTALDALERKFSAYPVWGHALAWMVTGAAFATLLEGSMMDLVAAGGVSLVTFLLSHLAGQASRFTFLTTLLVAFAAGLCAQVLFHVGVPIEVSTVVIAAILILIPGLSLTMAMNEIAARHLVSGSSRLMDAFMCLAQLAFGAVMGAGAVKVVMTAPAAMVPRVPLCEMWHGWSWVAVFLLSVALMVGFAIPLRKAAWGAVCCYVAYGISHVVGAHMGVTAAMFCGAMGVGLISNALARWLKAPSSVLSTFGIILLVPGSRTYALLRDWASGNAAASGTEQAAQALMMFLALMAGLLFANAALPPRKSL